MTVKELIEILEPLKDDERELHAYISSDIGSVSSRITSVDLDSTTYIYIQSLRHEREAE